MDRIPFRMHNVTEKPLRLLVDCHVFDGNLQGTTTYLKGLYTALISDRSIHFFLVAFDTDNLETIFGSHTNVTYLKYNSHNKFVRLLWEIPRLIKKNAIDYAHFQYVVPPIKNCRFIVTIHDVLFLDYTQYFPLSYRVKNKFLFKKSAESSNIVLTVSNYSKTQIQKHFQIPEVTITPNAVDAAFVDSYDKPTVQAQVKDKFDIENYWVFTSRWEPRKNHISLLKCFVENEHYKIYELVFIGDMAIGDPLYTEYYNALDQKIKDRVITLAKVNFEDLVSLIRGATLSVYPSIAEGFGIPPLESLAAGIPTASSNTTAMADFGFLGNCHFNPLDLCDMNAKIINALSDKNVVEKRTAMLQEYNWAAAADNFKSAVFNDRNRR